MNPRRVYDLAFVSRAASLSRVPEIVLTLPQSSCADLLDRFKELAEINAGRIQEYLGGIRKRPKFTQGDRGLFGYKSCCRIEQEERAPHLYFELRARHRKETVVTSTLVLHAASNLFSSEDDCSGETGQRMELHTSFGGSFHSHAIGGTVFPPLGRWLLSQARLGKGKEIRHRITLAMSEAWHAVATRQLARYSSYCDFHLHEDGRPSFGCFGDACDVAVYPDGLMGEMGKSFAELSSHNLDNPMQQIAFLAGLAELWNMDRQE